MALSLLAATLLLTPFTVATTTPRESIVVSPPVHARFPPTVLTPLVSRNSKLLLNKRDRRAALEPKTQETFSWIAPDGTLASLNLRTPGDDENIVNLEAIDDLVQKITCPTPSSSSGTGTGPGTLKIQFAQAADFNDAQDVWEWVNRSPANHFIMVVGAGVCSSAQQRAVYNVTGITYDDGIETAALAVQEISWKQAAKVFDLTIGRVDDDDVPASVPTTKVSRRGGRVPKKRGLLDGAKKVVNGVKDAVTDVVDDIPDVVNEVVDKVKEIPGKVEDGIKAIPGKVVQAVPIPAAAQLLTAGEGDVQNPEFTIPFDHSFPDKALTVSAGSVSVSALCKDCFTTGSLNVKGRFRSEQFGQLDEAWVEICTAGLSAKAIISLGLTGALTDKLFARNVSIFTFSPAGIAIPGVLTIGPTISVDMGVEISEITAGVNIHLGGTAKIPASSARINFLGKNKDDGAKSRGWKPEFKPEPFAADGFVEAKASAFIKPVIGLEISVVETGLAAEIAAMTPVLTASVKGIVCEFFFFFLFFPPFLLPLPVPHRTLSLPDLGG